MPRLDRLISRNVGLGRRQVRRLGRAGRICDADGSVLTDLQEPVSPSDLPVTVQIDGELHLLYHRVDVLQHKPVGVVTAHRDGRHPTAFELLGEAPLWRELRAVGRLDRMTSGLLLWTTDGALLHRLTHPRYAVPRVYQAGLDRDFRDPTAELELDDGHRPSIAALRRIDRSELHPSVLAPAEAREFATITLTTGRFHEVRRIFAALGSEVVALSRIAFGTIELPAELEAGAFHTVDLRERFRGLSPADA